MGSHISTSVLPWYVVSLRTSVAVFRVPNVFSVHIHHENLVAANQRATREAAPMRAPVISMRVENAKTVVEEVSEDFQTLHHLGVLILGGVHK